MLAIALAAVVSAATSGKVGVDEIASRSFDGSSSNLMQSLSRVWSVADLCVCRQLGQCKYRRKGESAKRVFPSRLFESNICDAAGSYGIDISTPGRG